MPRGGDDPERAHPEAALQPTTNGHHGSVCPRTSYPVLACFAQNRSREVFVHFTVARHVLLALTVVPYIVFRTMTQKPPAACGESLLQVAALHSDECTRSCVALFL